MRFWHLGLLNFLWTNLFCSAKKLFCSVNFFPAKIFSGTLEKGNLSEQEKILAGKKLTEQKSFFAKQKRFSHFLFIILYVMLSF
jgi:hypothetical protein